MSPEASTAEIRLRCEVTGRTFILDESERLLLAKLSLPSPDRSPEERARLRMSFASAGLLFMRPCDRTGASIISVFPPESSFPVYEADAWAAREWNPFRFGKTYKPKSPFLPQLQILWHTVPRPGMFRRGGHGSAHQFDHEQAGFFLANLSCFDTEACLYCCEMHLSRDCMDCASLRECSRCYEAVDCTFSTGLRFADHCRNCHDSWFLENCEDCNFCAFCVGLRGKKFYIFNKQVTETEYHRLLASYSLNARPMLELAKNRFVEHSAKFPSPAETRSQMHGGNGMLESCFGGGHIEQCWHCADLLHASYCYEGEGYGNGLHESAYFVGVGNGARRVFHSVECFGNVEEVYFSAYCESSRELIGCVGLKNAEHCIFNQKYSPKEFAALKAIILAEIANDEASRSFLPASMSDFAYDLSRAAISFPMSEVQAELLGYQWYDTEAKRGLSPALGMRQAHPNILFSEVPEQVNTSTLENLVGPIYLCEVSGDPFKFSKPELDILTGLGVSLPIRSPRQRRFERHQRASSRKLRETQCSVSQAPARSCAVSQSKRPDWAVDVFNATEFLDWKKPE